MKTALPQISNPGRPFRKGAGHAGPYEVGWRTELVAATPLDAAIQALRIHRGHNDEGTFFEVTAPDGAIWLVDLSSGGCSRVSPCETTKNEKA